MALSRKGKEKAPVKGEGESSQRNVHSANAYILLPQDPSLQPVLRLEGCRTFDAGHPEKTKQVAKIISQEVRQAYLGPYSRYTNFSDRNKEFIQAEFLKHYQFAPDVNLTEAWNTFRMIADVRLQDMLNKCIKAATHSYGDSMLEWKERGAAPRPYDAWIKQTYWSGLVDYWCSDAFSSRSAWNASNRANAEGSGATTGS
ncbi:uncharacterized protein LOC144562216 [Carex rostrata]